MNLLTIIYPIFEKCQDYTLDVFWKDVFFSCACGKFPKGCKYDPNTNTLYTKTQILLTKTKSEATTLPHSPEELYLVIMDIFKNNFNMFSLLDMQIKKEELEKIQKQNQVNMNCEWKKLKPRSIKEFLIINFISDLSYKYSLTPKEIKLLYANIGVWFQLKKISSEDIDYSNYTINSIRGISFNEKTRVWSNTNSIKLVGKVEKINKSQKFDQSLDKFIRDYKYRKSKI